MFDEIEVTLVGDVFRFREIRYVGDETARWANMDRAHMLLGLDRLRELMESACSDRIDKILDATF